MSDNEEELIASLHRARSALHEGDEVKTAREQLNSLSTERQEYIKTMAERQQKCQDEYLNTQKSLKEEAQTAIADFDRAEAVCQQTIELAEAAYEERLMAVRAYYGHQAKGENGVPGKVMVMELDGKRIELPMEMDTENDISSVLKGSRVNAEIDTVVDEAGNLVTRIRSRLAQQQSEVEDFLSPDEPDLEKLANDMREVIEDNDDIDLDFSGEAEQEEDNP
jgi:hypothetical protein